MYLTDVPVFKDVDVDGGAAFRVYNSSRELMKQETSDKRNNTKSGTTILNISVANLNDLIKLIKPMPSDQMATDKISLTK